MTHDLHERILKPTAGRITRIEAISRVGGLGMRKKQGPEANKTWVHLADESAHAFDATNGLLKREDTLEHREESDGLSDAERSAAAAIISGGFSARM